MADRFRITIEGGKLPPELREQWGAFGGIGGPAFFEVTGTQRKPNETLEDIRSKIQQATGAHSVHVTEFFHELDDPFPLR